MVVRTIISNQTEWLFNDLTFFRAKIRLLLSGNGERSLHRPVPLFACQLYIPVVEARWRHRDRRYI